MEAKVDLSGIDFKELFAASIIKALDDSKRETLINAGIQSLFKATSNYSDRNALMDAFEVATRQVATEQIKTFLKEDTDINNKIQQIIRDAVNKIFTDSYDNTVSKVADAIISGLYSEKY